MRHFNGEREAFLKEDGVNPTKTVKRAFVRAADLISPLGVLGRSTVVQDAVSARMLNG